MFVFSFIFLEVMFVFSYFVKLLLIKSEGAINFYFQRMSWIVLDFQDRAKQNKPNKTGGDMCIDY